MVRVLVVDDQQLIREGIASLLAIQDGIEVVGTAEDGRDAIEQATATRPDIVLMDVRMPVMDGVAAVSVLRREFPAIRVIMLTTFDDEEYVVAALKAGATGYLLKDLPSHDLAAAIRLAHRGVAPLGPAAAALVTALVSASPGPASPAPAAVALPQRELAVLRLVARGMTNREIASELHLSEGTVKNYLSKVLERLGLRDRTQAAIFARDRGLI